MRQFSTVLILFLVGAGSLAKLEAQQPSAKGSGVREAFLTDLNDLEKKLTSLAEAIPQDKFSWRPAKGVRSFSEVYMHTALSNYFFIAALGVKPPAGINENAENTVTQKAKVIEALKASMTFVRQAVTNVPESELHKMTNLEGQHTTYEGSLLITSGHMHEHLGQLIAYARMNGIVPPWSN